MEKGNFVYSGWRANGFVALVGLLVLIAGGIALCVFGSDVMDPRIGLRTAMLVCGVCLFFISQFTYEDDLGAHFMHTETFEEINIDKNLIDNYDLMADGQIVEVMFHTEKESVLSAELPPIVDMEVTYTEPGIKGDTASTNSLKPATVNTGATIKVPLFINTGDKIRVDTRTREYYERIK